jgi:energy-coupling factor transport system permease protein
MGRSRIDIRVAILEVLFYSVTLFWLDGWAGMAACATMLVAFAIALRCDVRRLLLVGIPLYVLLAFVVVAYIPSGVGEGLYYACRILLLTAGAIAMASAYDNNDFARAIASLLAPLRHLRVPVDDFAMAASIALRFIPVSYDELQRVASAQKSRASRLDTGGLVVRLKAWANVFIPVIVGLFRRAEVLAGAMDSRCYGAGPRTSLQDLSLRPVDVLCIAFAALCCFAVGYFL